MLDLPNERLTLTSLSSHGPWVSCGSVAVVVWVVLWATLWTTGFGALGIVNDSRDEQDAEEQGDRCVPLQCYSISLLSLGCCAWTGRQGADRETTHLPAFSSGCTWSPPPFLILDDKPLIFLSNTPHHLSCHSSSRTPSLIFVVRLPPSLLDPDNLYLLLAR